MTTSCFVLCASTVLGAPQFTSLEPPALNTLAITYRLTLLGLDSSVPPADLPLAGEWLVDLTNGRERLVAGAGDARRFVAWDGEIGYRVVGEGAASSASRIAGYPQELIQSLAPSRLLFPFAGWTPASHCGGDRSRAVVEDRRTVRLHHRLSEVSFLRLHYETDLETDPFPQRIALYVAQGDAGPVPLEEAQLRYELEVEQVSVIDGVPFPTRIGRSLPRSGAKAIFEVVACELNPRVARSDFGLGAAGELHDGFFDEFRKGRVLADATLAAMNVYDVDEESLCALLEVPLPAASSEERTNCIAPAIYGFLRHRGVGRPLAEVVERTTGTSPEVPVGADRAVAALKELGAPEAAAFSVPEGSFARVAVPFIALMGAGLPTSAGHYVLVTQTEPEITVVNFPRVERPGREAFLRDWSGVVIATGMRPGPFLYVGAGLLALAGLALLRRALARRRAWPFRNTRTRERLTVRGADLEQTP
jgi:hypothetical protein